MTTLHITPRSPQLEDFAIRLADSLESECNIGSLFYNLEASYSDNSNTLIASIEQQTAEKLNNIIVHMSRPMYQLHNSKQQVTSFIKQLKSALKQRSLSLITIFHDIPINTLTPLQLVSPKNRLLIKELAALSSTVITNNHFFEQYLVKQTESPIICINSFSRVGELESNNLLGASRCNLVIFGGPERAYIYKHKRQLQKVYDALRVDKIVDIGSDLNWNRLNTKGLNIEKMGLLKKSDISDQLTISKAGIIHYSKHHPCGLSKSNIFNAYKAHGVAPLVTHNIESQSERIIHETNYFTINQPDRLRSDRSIARMAHTNYAYYKTHNQAQWANLISSLITS